MGGGIYVGLALKRRLEVSMMVHLLVVHISCSVLVVCGTIIRGRLGAVIVRLSLISYWSCLWFLVRVESV